MFTWEARRVTAFKCEPQSVHVLLTCRPPPSPSTVCDTHTQVVGFVVALLDPESLLCFALHLRRYAGTRLAAQRSLAGWLSETTGGLTYLEFIRTLNKRVEEDWAGVQVCGCLCVCVWGGGVMDGGTNHALWWAVGAPALYMQLPKCCCATWTFWLEWVGRGWSHPLGVHSHPQQEGGGALGGRAGG